MYFVSLNAPPIPAIPPDRLIPYERFVFQGGEPHIKMDTDFLQSYMSGDRQVTIVARIYQFEDMAILAQLVGVLRHNNSTTIDLVLLYIPGGRQDRVTSLCEPFTLHLYASLINSLDFDNVVTIDPHSDVTNALIDDLIAIDTIHFVQQAVNSIPGYGDDFKLIIPDGGAVKRAALLNQHLRLPEVVCGKKRDVATGKLTGFRVYDSVEPGSKGILVDDICDGGGTFVGLYDKLKEAGFVEVHLIVTHGIFSKGLSPLFVFDSVHTSNSFYRGSSPDCIVHDVYNDIIENIQ